MIRHVFSGLMLIAIALLASSCAPDHPASDSTPASSLGTHSGAVAGGGPTSDMPVPPKGAMYTIYCQSISDPNHIYESRLLRQSLVNGTKMKDWYIVHSADSSTLYYGFYRSVDPRDPNDGKDGKRAIADLDSIRAMTDSNGFRPFSASLPVPLDSPDPSANPAWDLSRSGGYYSLQIAVYKDSPDRKEAAVDAVRKARAQGIEAYYYHGPVASSVCIGSWPKESAREEDPAQENNDPNAQLVLTTTPLSDQAVKELSDRGYKAVAPKLTPVDPSMLEAMHQYSTFAVNGMVMMKPGINPATGQPAQVPSPSFLVKVPRPGDDQGIGSGPMVSGDGSDAATSAAGLPAATPASQQPAAGMGDLKSLGE